MSGERKRYRALTGITLDKVYVEGDHLLLDLLIAARLLAICAIEEAPDPEADAWAQAEAAAEEEAKANAEAEAKAKAEAEARAKFENWPPADDVIINAGHDVLGAILTGFGADPKPFNSKDARRAAIRELIAKQKDQVNT